MEKSVESRVPFRLETLYKYGLYIVFFIMITGLSILTPKFYSPENIKHIFLYSAPLGIGVIGVTFVIVTQGYDLSTGMVMFLSAVNSAIMINNGYSFFFVVLVSVVCGILAGCVNGLLVAKFKVVPFIATLATMTAGRGFTLILSKQQTLYINNNVGDFIVKTRILGIPFIVYLLLVLAIIGQIVLTRTGYGRQLYAIGNHAVAARKIGIKVTLTTFSVYLISGACAALAGLISALQVGAVTPTLGDGTQFVITSAAVLGGVSLFGGRGNILPGALTGVLMFTIIENGLILMNANPYAYTIVRGLVIFLAVAVDCIRNTLELK